MFNDPIMKMMMDRYGHIDDMKQLHAALREDGLGEFVDLFNDNPRLIDSFMEDHKEEIDQSLRDYLGSGTMVRQEQVQGTPLTVSDTFRFDPQACLRDCDGKCCKGRNYLRILYPDILKLLTSSAADYLNINSTRDLFENKPPIIELFFNEEYSLYLPYLRFLPLGAASDTPPENAEDSICPFLYPIAEVCSFYNLQIPQNTKKGAMGCILMDCKPSTCKLSPIGQTRGMIIGKLSYEYIAPNKNCSGCNTDIEIPLLNYICAIIPSFEEEKRALFHKMIMAHNAIVPDI